MGNEGFGFDFLIKEEEIAGSEEGKSGCDVVEKV